MLHCSQTQHGPLPIEGALHLTIPVDTADVLVREMSPKSHTHSRLHGPLNATKLDGIDSLQFDEPWNEEKRRSYGELRKRDTRVIYAAKYMLDLVFGYAIGVLAVGIHNLTHYLSHLRSETFLDATSQGSAWLINTGFMLLYLTPAMLGVIWQPAAGSSGVPGIVATLNGCDLPNTVTIYVWIARVPPPNTYTTPPPPSRALALSATELQTNF